MVELLRRPDWGFLLELAEGHGVLGLVAPVLLELDEATVPRAFRQQMLERRRAHVLSALGLLAEMFGILEHFSEAGVRTLVLKGPALSLQAYGDATVRQFGDIDLLVRQKDAYRVTEIMTLAGFDARVPLAAVAAGKTPGEYLFRRPNTKVIFEVHTEKTLRYFPNPLAMEELFERQAKLVADGRSVPTYSNEDALVAMCTHGAKHCWERLMWIGDVAAMLNRQSSLDWEVAGRIAASLGARRILHTGLLLAQQLLRAPLPTAIAAEANADRGARRLVARIAVWLPAAGQASTGLLNRAIFRAQMRGGFLKGISYLTRLSLSPTEADWRESYGHRSLRILETGRRLARLVGKYGRDSSH